MHLNSQSLKETLTATPAFPIPSSPFTSSRLHTSFHHTATHSNHLHLVFIVITVNENKIPDGNYPAHHRIVSYDVDYGDQPSFRTAINEMLNH
jgi:hypothetical protein